MCTSFRHIVWLQHCFAFNALGQALELPVDVGLPLLLRAVKVFRSVQPYNEELGKGYLIEYQAEYERYMVILRERLDPATFDAAWAQGQAMDRKQIVAYLLEDETQPSAS